MCARAISGTSTPEEVAANGFTGSWSTELKVAVNSLAHKIANCPAARKLEHDVIVEPFFTDPAQPVQRPPPAAGPPLASSPDVEEDLQSEIASLRRELALARRDAEPELNTGEGTNTIMQLAAKAAVAGVSTQEIEKAM